MRNIRDIRFNFWDPTDEFPDSPVAATCWDTEKDEAICAIGPSSHDPSIKLVRLKETPTGCEHRVFALWVPSVPGDKIVSLHHSIDLTTCVVLASGDIVTVEERGGNGPKVEIVGSMDEAITAAAWSPDGEVFALTTEKTVTLMTSRSFDPVAEATMTADDLALSKHVSVGWGKKETQFQGRGAKALRDPTIPEKVDEGVLSARDDGTATISWRGDGAYVAINTVEPGGATPRRVVRVYSREGTLDSVSEPVDGLESALSWRPAGNLLAGIQRLPNRVQVVFFERNGLRHGEFTLRTGGSAASLEGSIWLAWNSDSTVLAVVLADCVQFWTMGNYHWYLKQEITVAPLGGVSWHPETPLRLTIGLSTTAVMAEYVFTTPRESCHNASDTGSVAVIDGKTIKLTPFRRANVPPPMALFEIEVGSAAVDAAFGERTVCILHRQGIDIYEVEQQPKLVGTIPLGSVCGEEALESGAVPRQICLSRPSEAHVLVSHPMYGPQLYAVTFGPQPGEVAAELCPVELGGDISLSSFKAGGGGYLQQQSGAISLLDGTRIVENVARFPAFMPWFEVVQREGATGPAAFGLSRRGHLHSGTQVLARNCTSFLTTPSHVVYTTTNHFVKFIHIGDSDEEAPPDDPNDERCRRVERGSRLVTAMPSRMSLVLQMPRGNLETIYPRAMVLAGIRGHIDAKNYREAFLCSRTQRVDLNILYDHAPAQFLANAGLFLDQIRDVAYLDLFLSSLKDEDVTQTTYRNTKRSAPPREDGAAPDHQPLGSKVNRICDAVLRALEGRRATNLQNIITANVCKVPPALEDGLEIVAGLMREDEALAEKAIEHICFLVDVNRLYDTALGLYNLELTLLVAQQSQRDPREYVPFIQNLHTLPDLRRQFSIDDHLARRSKAITHLKALDAFEELKNYTVKHSLYQDALRLYRYDETRLRVLTELYAAWLEAQSRFQDAGLAYESLQQFAKATSCYSAAGAACWQECLAAAYQQDPPLSDSALAELATTAADALWEAKDYAAAARIHLEHLGSLEQAVACYCKGYHFAEAIRVVTVRRQLDLLSSAVDTDLGEALGSITEFLADCKAQLKAQVPRIMDLRRRAIEDPLAFYEGERPGGGNIPDDISVTASSRLTTNASLFTRYTGKGMSKGGSSVGTGVSRATSKQRRKEEKKRARGRKGTVYEEEYLVNSVRRLVERVESSKSEVERLVAGLVRRNMAERARAVEALTTDVIEACVAATKEVFGGLRGEEQERQKKEKVAEPESSEPEAVGGGEAEVYKPVGGEAVWYEFMESRGKPLEPPLITTLEKLSLFG